MSDAPTEREPESIWTSLRRRKVVQWGLVYVAAAWGFLQGLEYLSESFNWPQQVRQIAVLVLVIGLPIVLVLAWYHGDRGQQRISTPEFAILTLLLLLGGGAFWYYQRTSDTASAPAPPPPSTAAIATDASIAVLPFVNMSPDKDQEYFADGISEELLNLLAQVPELRVIARTSSFSFKGKDVDIAEIARRLNVANVLEGSVRKSGDTLRITAQLVRASDSSHLWSQTYDRKATDVFKVQDEIAGSVVSELKMKLLSAAPTVRTTDPEAYALYLRARQLGRQATYEALKQSHALYEKVLAIDPTYAPAWTGLSFNYLGELPWGVRSNDEVLRLAQEAVEKAVAIDPEYASAYASLGSIAISRRDFAGAVRHLERALALDPADLNIISQAAALLGSLGRLNQAIAITEYVVARDPVNASAVYSLGTCYFYTGQFDEAIAQLRIALSLQPGSGAAHSTIGWALLLKGQPEAALVEMQQEASEVWRMIGFAMTYHALGRTADAAAALAALKTRYAKDWPYQIAEVHAYRGEADDAFEWLDKAVEYADPGISEIVPDPLFANLHADPRWLPFLRKINAAPEQLAAIKFDVKVPK